MADDVNPVLRTELNAALSVLAPQIAGLDDLAATGVSISTDLRNAIIDQSNIRKHRRDLILATLAALDAAVVARTTLEGDGYPALPNATVVDFLIAEFDEEMSDLESARAVFQAAASALSISLGTTSPKEPPAPPSV